MKVVSFLVLCLSLCFVSLTGCGGSGETQVIEAPQVEEADPSMGDMDEDEYNNAMNQSISGQGE